MLGWFHEHNATVYMLLGVALVIVGAVWIRTQDRRLARAAAVIAGLLAALALLDLFGPESAGREIKRKVEEMARAIKTRQMDVLNRHVAESFHYEGFGKQAMIKLVEGFIASGMLTEVEVWKFEPPEINSKDGTAKITFRAKPKGSESPELFFRTVAQFVRDPDGQWRMKTFDIYTEPHGHHVRIPQMPVSLP